jgi:hypothetical protein
MNRRFVEREPLQVPVIALRKLAQQESKEMKYIM